MRVNFGPGYRLYFAFDGNDIVLLLIGGDKKSQRGDIKQAQKLWREYSNGET